MVIAVGIASLCCHSQQAASGPDARQPSPAPSRRSVTVRALTWPAPSVATDACTPTEPPSGGPAHLDHDHAGPLGATCGRDTPVKGVSRPQVSVVRAVDNDRARSAPIGHVPPHDPAFAAP